MYWIYECFDFGDVVFEGSLVVYFSKLFLIDKIFDDIVYRI